MLNGIEEILLKERPDVVLVSRQYHNVVKYIIYCLHNQPRRIEYEEVHCDAFWRREKNSWRACIQGNQKSQKILNALILLGCDEGEYQTGRSTNEDMARVLQISMRKIDRVKKRFVEDGIDFALNNKKSSRTYAKKTDGDFIAHLIGLSCSEPPEGFARWSLRLLADKVVELNYIDSISHETVRRVLKKTKSNHGNVRNG